MLTKYPDKFKEMYEVYKTGNGNIMEIISKNLSFFEDKGEKITGITLGGYILEYAREKTKSLETLSKE